MQLLHFWRKKGDEAVGVQPPIFLELRSSKNFIICAVAMAIFTDIFLYGLIVPVFPFALESRANIPADDVQTWVSVLLAIYGGGLLFASPICGFLADRTTTRRSPLLWGLVALAASTVMLCVGNHIAVFIVGRLTQGVAAAVVWVVGLALLVDTVGKDDIAKSMGIVSIAMSAATFMAPLLGGVVYDRGGYYAVFAMAFVLLGIDIFWRLVIIEKKVAARYKTTTVGSEQGVISPTDISSAEEVKAVEESNTTHPNDIECADTATNITANGNGSTLSTFATLLRNPRLLTALWACMVEGILLTSIEASLPLYTRDNFHFGSTGAGLIFLAIVIPGFLAPLVGWVCDTYGTRWISTAGFVLCCPFFVLLRLPNGDETSDIVLMCAILALLGASLALVIPPIMAEITLVLHEMEEEKPGRFGRNGAYAQGYGLYNVAWSAGTLVGPLWAGFVRDVAGWGTMTWSLGLLSFATAIIAAIYTGGRINFRTDFRITKLPRSSN